MFFKILKSQLDQQRKAPNNPGIKIFKFNRQFLTSADQHDKKVSLVSGNTLKITLLNKQVLF